MNTIMDTIKKGCDPLDPSFRCYYGFVMVISQTPFMTSSTS